MWVDFTMTTTGTEEDPLVMHFISEAIVKLDKENDSVHLEYSEPSTEDEDIQTKVDIFPTLLYVLREGNYSMEQSFDLSGMTTGLLELPEAKFELSTNTFKYEKSIDFETESGLVDLEYSVYIQGEYSGDYSCQIRFYNSNQNQVQKEVAN